MTNNKQLQLALEIATMAHKNVQRRNGDPYIFHALRVANNSTYIRTKTQKRKKRQVSYTTSLRTHPSMKNSYANKVLTTLFLKFYAF